MGMKPISLKGKTGTKLSFGIKGPSKVVKVPAAFAVDSDSEEEISDNSRSQQNSSEPGAIFDEASCAFSPEETANIEKLAELVARCGPKYEEFLSANESYKFLHNKASPKYLFFKSRLKSCMEKLKIEEPRAVSTLQFPLESTDFVKLPTLASSNDIHSNQFAMSRPPISQDIPVASSSIASLSASQQPLFATNNAITPQPVVQYNPVQQTLHKQEAPRVRHRSRWDKDDKLQPIVDSKNTSRITLSGPQSFNLQASVKGDVSLAAMEAFAAAAAEREKLREMNEELEQEVQAEEVLNETSFDRRKSLHVFKEDGTVGHHMQARDFIPKEELAKLLANSDNPIAKAESEAIEAASRIKSDNIGHKLLSQMGWKEGEGLGANKTGMSSIIKNNFDFGSEKRGLGTEYHGEVHAGDDEFEVYRKRMMLGYKYRFFYGIGVVSV